VEKLFESGLHYLCGTYRTMYLAVAHNELIGNDWSLVACCKANFSTSSIISLYEKKCMLVHRPIPMSHFNLNADLLFVNLISS